MIEGDRVALESALVARASDFDVAALLRVLFAIGYSWDTILFEGVRTLARSPRIVHSVDFPSDPGRCVVVRLHAGLLSPNGALPSYFGRFADAMEDPRAFLSFVRFFDHVLLRDHAYAVHPALGAARPDPAADGDPGGGVADRAGAGPTLATAYRVAAGVDSVPQLHGLFRAVVPELPVDVARTTFRSRTPDDGARFGSASLDGSAILGPLYRTSAGGYLARLHAEDEVDDRGRPWEEVVAERWTRTLLPALGRLRKRVEVRIVFETYATAARVGAGQMGRRRIRTREPEGWEVFVATT